jgi:lipopolysaccharide export LptBFGC system permease protein LptF
MATPEKTSGSSRNTIYLVLAILLILTGGCSLLGDLPLFKGTWFWLVIDLVEIGLGIWLLKKRKARL